MNLFLKVNRKHIINRIFLLPHYLFVYVVNMINLGTDFPKYFLFWDSWNI